MISEMTKQQIQENIIKQNDAQVRLDSDLRPRWTSRVEIDLSVAASFQNPYDIGEPFSSFYVEDATDDQVEVKIAFSSSQNYSVKNYVKIKKNSAIEFDKKVDGAVLSWDAQSGKTMTIVFFMDAKFKSGSFTQQIVGGVTISEGTGFTNTAVALTAATSVQIFAQDSARKVGRFVNLSGAIIYVGASGAGTSGYPVLSGAEFTWKNTQQLYGYSVAGTSIVKMEQT